MSILGKFGVGELATRTLQTLAARGSAFTGAKPGTKPRGTMWGDPAGLETGESTAGMPDRVCGAASCTSGWMNPWKNRVRPVFEEDWACSTRCLQEMVENAVRREMGENAAVDEELPLQHRVPLGLVLLAQGWITQPQLQSALASQRASGVGRIGDWLNKECGLDEERIARGLGVQWNCPVLSLHGFLPNRMALVMPKRFISEFGLVPIRSAGSTILYVAFPDRLKPALSLSLEQMCRFKVESGLLTETQLETARTRLMSAEGVPLHLRHSADGDEMASAIVKLVERKQPVMTRFVRVNHYYWLRMWMEEAAIPKPGELQHTIEDTEDHIFLMA